jgi:hypothetical protein
MGQVQIESVLDPLDDPDLLAFGVEALKLAEAMGLLPEGEAVRELGLPAMRRVAALAGEAGIGVSAAASLARPRPTRGQVLGALRSLVDALEESPSPRSEWPALIELLEPERLGSLVDVSPSSLRRYAAGMRPTPDAVAARLHLVAKVCADLLGAYNDIGARRWFERPRQALGGLAPAHLLSGPWDPDDAGPARVRALARSLVGGSAT